MRDWSMGSFFAIKFAVPLLLLLLLAACEPGISVKVEGGNTPTFTISGGSKLVDFFVCCETNEGPIERESALWEIEPYSGQGKQAEDVRTITYGVVPQGYYQTKPKNGQPPPPLMSGKRYTYHVVGYPTSAGAAFEIRDGKAVEIPLK